ncbi:MAG TPA: multicopper oxidase domain-containing protein [Candidatus Limnocylindria bacterium]|nr:multicopper oxidase domain-containing protein [Candidatus Limnocylindria bacterium]
MRGVLLAVLGVAAMTAAAWAVPLPSSVAGRPQIAAPAAVTAPCTPNVGAARGALPQPPVVDVSKLPNHAFALNVLSYVQSNKTTIYCYTLAGGPAQYVEAPTIRVRAGGSFTMTLVDKIPPSITTPTPPPHAAPNAPDGCAQLPYDEPLPPASKSGYAGRARVAATMPPMAANDTNFHTHGWHVDPNVDNVFKSLVYAKNGACTYTFDVPLSQPPGSYWYHAHLHGLASDQVGGGLAGALIVLPADGSTPDYPDTVLLVKNDNAPPTGAPSAQMDAMAGMAMHAPLATLRENQHYAALPHGARGKLQAPNPTASFDPFNPPNEPSGWAFPTPPASPPPYCAPPQTVGDPLEVNGLPIPNSTTSGAIPRVLQLVNSPRRYRLFNASADSFLNVMMLDGNGRPETLNVLARDGVPVNWHESNANPPLYVTRSNVMIPPSGRVDLLVFGKSATQTIVGAQGTASTAPPGGTPFCTGYIGFSMPPRGIVSIRPFYGPANATAAHAPVAKLATRTPGDVFASSTPVTGRRALTFTQYDDLTWYVTETSKAGWMEKPFWLQTPPPGVGSDYLPTIRVKQNSVEEWTLINASPEVHAFHIHQLTFVALQSAWEPVTSRTFLDSISLPAATLAPGQSGKQYPLLIPSKTVVKIDFRGVDKGLFVYHCHMLFHEDHGMMGIIEVY